MSPLAIWHHGKVSICLTLKYQYLDPQTSQLLGTLQGHSCLHAAVHYNYNTEHYSLEDVSKFLFPLASDSRCLAKRWLSRLILASASSLFDPSPDNEQEERLVGWLVGWLLIYV